MKDYTTLPLPTFAMLVQCDGGEAPVDALAAELPDGLAVVRRDVGVETERFFWSEAVRTFDKREWAKAYDLLLAELRQVNGIWRGTEGVNGRLALLHKGVHWLPSANEPGAMYVLGESAFLTPQHTHYRKLSGDGTRAEEFRHWLSMAKNSQYVAEALRALSEEPLDWFALWKVFELARVIIGGGGKSKPIWTHTPPFASEKDVLRFEVSANDRRISGLTARHSLGTTKKDKLIEVAKCPMSIQEARAWVVKLWRRLMLAVSKAPEKYHLNPAALVVSKQYRADGRGTLLVMLHDDELAKQWNDGDAYVRKMLGLTPPERSDQH